MPLELEFEEGELLDLLIMGIGSGSKGAIAGWLTKFAPELGVDTAGLIAGGGLYLFGARLHPLVRKFGAGVLIGAIGQFTSGLTGGILGGGGGTPPATSSPPATDLASLAAAEAGRAI